MTKSEDASGAAEVGQAEIGGMVKRVAALCRRLEAARTTPERFEARAYFFAAEDNSAESLGRSAHWRRLVMDAETQSAYGGDVVERLLDRLEPRLRKGDDTLDGAYKFDFETGEFSKGPALISLREHAQAAQWFDLVQRRPNVRAYDEDRDFYVNAKQRLHVSVLSAPGIDEAGETEDRAFAVLHPSPSAKKLRAADKVLMVKVGDRYAFADDSALMIDLEPALFVWGEVAVGFQKQALQHSTPIGQHVRRKALERARKQVEKISQPEAGAPPSPVKLAKEPPVLIQTFTDTPAGASRAEKFYEIAVACSKTFGPEHFERLKKLNEEYKLGLPLIEENGVTRILVDVEKADELRLLYLAARDKLLTSPLSDSLIEAVISSVYRLKGGAVPDQLQNQDAARDRGLIGE